MLAVLQPAKWGLRTGIERAGIAGRSALFFAPGHIQQRRADWDPGVFEKKAFLFWHKAALRSRAWLKFDRVTGLAGMQGTYHRVLNGESTPERGVVVTL